MKVHLVLRSVKSRQLLWRKTVNAKRVARSSPKSSLMRSVSSMNNWIRNVNKENRSRRLWQGHSIKSMIG